MVAVFLLEPLKHSFSALARAAVQSNSHVCSKRLQSRFTALLLMLKKPEGIAHNLAGTCVATTTDLILDELLEMGTNYVTGRHHRSRRTKTMLSIFDSHGTHSEICVRDEASPEALTRPPA
jgi:hypothetical protein